MDRPGSFAITLKVLLIDAGRMLVLRDRASGAGDLPGGRITEAELYAPWTRALARELLEELGPDARHAVEDEPRLTFPHRLPSTGEAALGMLYVGRWLGGELRLSDEHDDAAWWPVDQTPHPWLRGTLREAVERLLTEDFPKLPTRSPRSTAGPAGA